MTSPPPRPGRKALFLDLPPEEPTPHEPVPPDTTKPAVPVVPESIIEWFKGLASGEWKAPPSEDTLPAEYGPLSEHLSEFWATMTESREREKTLITAFSHIPYPAAVLDNRGSLLTQSHRYREMAPTSTVETSGIPDSIHLDEKTRHLLFDAGEEVSEVVQAPGKEGSEGRSGSMIRHLIPFTPSPGESAYALLILEEEPVSPGGERDTTEGISPAQVEERVAGALATAREEMLQETTRLAGELAEARSALDHLSPLPEVLLSNILTSFPVPAFRITKYGCICASNEHVSPVIGSVPDAGPGGIDLRSLPLNPGACDVLITAAGEGKGTAFKGEVSREGTTFPYWAVLFPLPSTRDTDAGDSILLLVTGEGRTGTLDEMEHHGVAIQAQETRTEPGEGEMIGESPERPEETEKAGGAAGMEPGSEPMEKERGPADHAGLPGIEGEEPVGGAATEVPGESEGPASDNLKAGPVSVPGEERTSQIESTVITPEPGDEHLTSPENGHSAGSSGATGTTETPQLSPGGGSPPCEPGEGAEPGGAGENLAEMTFDIVQFELAGEEYALDIRFSREIVEMMSITPIPRSPSHIAGVMNLRGEITTIINIYNLLGLEGGDDFNGKKIIVLSPETAGGENIGIIVDDVRSVLQIQGSDVEFFKGTSQSGSRVRMRGIIKLGGGNASDRRPGSEEEKKLVIWVDMQQIIEEMMSDVQATGS